MDNTTSNRTNTSGDSSPTLDKILSDCERALTQCSQAAESLKDEEEKNAIIIALSQVASATVELQKRSMAEIASLRQALMESRQRELQWKELSDVYSEYRKKITEELESLKEIIAQQKAVKSELQQQLRLKDREIQALNEELAFSRDFLLRIESIHRRRLGLAKLQQRIDEDEAALVEQLQEFRAMIAENTSEK